MGDSSTRVDLGPTPVCAGDGLRLPLGGAGLSSGQHIWSEKLLKSIEIDDAMVIYGHRIEGGSIASAHDE